MTMLTGSAALAGILFVLNLYLPLSTLSGQGIATPRLAPVAFLDAPSVRAVDVDASVETPGLPPLQAPIDPPRVSPIEALSVQPGACGGWSHWHGASDRGSALDATRVLPEIPELEPPSGRSIAAAPLWSATLNVGADARSPGASGYSIYEGLGTLSSGGFTLNEAHFGVLSAMQRVDGFVLELAGVEKLRAGFVFDIRFDRGTRIERLSTCDSIQSNGRFGVRLQWTDAAVDWQPGDSATIAILPPDNADRLTRHRGERSDSSPFARFERVPRYHVGEAFDFRVRLTDHAPDDGTAFGADSLRITAGSLQRLKPIDGREDLWQVTIAPDGRRSVGVQLLSRPRCNGSAAVCVMESSMSSQELRVVVPGPRITARVLELPSYHSGLANVPIRIEFSEPLFSSLRILGKRALDTNGSPLKGVRRIEGRNDQLEVIVTPVSADEVEVALDADRICTDVIAACLDDLQRVSTDLSIAIPAATIHLTFDDGPHPVFTPQILDILAYYDARATFFVTGVGAQSFPELIRRMVNEGHTLANHTWNHDTLAGLSEEEFEETIIRTQQLLGEHATSCLRPPNYSIDEHTAERAARLGLRLIMGTVRTSDWMLPGAGVIAGRIYAGAEPNAVIVLHDGGGDRSQTVEGLRSAMWNLRNFNYSFEPVCQ